MLFPYVGINYIRTTLEPLETRDPISPYSAMAPNVGSLANLVLLAPSMYLVFTKYNEYQHVRT